MPIKRQGLENMRLNVRLMDSICLSDVVMRDRKTLSAESAVVFPSFILKII